LRAIAHKAPVFAGRPFFPKKNLIPDMSKKNPFLPLTALLLLLAACGAPENASDKNNGPEAENEYMELAVLEVRYDADANSLSARAALWRDTTPVLLPNGLFFNENPAPLVEIPGKPPHYRYEGKAKACPEKYAFTFLAPDKSQYIFEGPVPRLDSLRISPNVSMSKPLRLVWDGPPLSKEEALHVMIADAARGVRQVILDGPTQNSSVTFPGDQFKGLVPGKGELTLLRQAIREEKVRGVRVKSTLSHYPRRVEVILEK
jgi:hypothetical protein